MKKKRRNERLVGFETWEEATWMARKLIAHGATEAVAVKTFKQGTKTKHYEVRVTFK